jgi:hypothetical protein
VRLQVGLFALAVAAGGCLQKSVPSDEEWIPGEEFLDRPVDDINAGVQIRTCDDLYRRDYVPAKKKRAPPMKKKCHDVVLPALLDYFVKNLRPDTTTGDADQLCGYAYAALALEPNEIKRAQFDDYCCHHKTVDDSQACLGKDWVYGGKVHHIDYLHPSRQVAAP